MKREIKFRGLRTDGKGWVYGDLLQFHYENKFYILQFYGIESGDSLFNEVSVIPESVGQFTGLQDKNGVDIYEGDKLKSVFKGESTFLEIDGIVKHDPINPSFCIEYRYDGNGHLCYEYDFFQVGLRVNEVIGNIYNEKK